MICCWSSVCRLCRATGSRAQAAAVGQVNTCAVAQIHALGRSVVEHQRGALEDLLAHLLGGLHHRAARDVGGAGGVGAGVERREIGVGRDRPARPFSGTPRVSAAICASTVSEPVPRSVAPTSRLKLPSSFILMLAAPMSSPAMAVPCMQTAMPSPRRMCGRAGSACQVGSLAAGPSRWRRRPAPRTPPGRSSARSARSLRGPRPAPWPSAAGRPTRTAFLRRKSTTSKPMFDGDLVHQAFQRQQRLRRAVAAKGARHRLVGVDDLGVEAHVGAAVGGQAAQAGDAAHGQAVGAVRAGVLHDVHIQRVQACRHSSRQRGSVMVCGWRERALVNSCSRVYSKRTGPAGGHASGGRTGLRSAFPACRRSRRRCAA